VSSSKVSVKRRHLYIKTSCFINLKKIKHKINIKKNHTQSAHQFAGGEKELGRWGERSEDQKKKN
jgi:hypothetical protein